MGRVVNATSRPFYPRERPGTHRTGGWVGPQGRSRMLRKISPLTGIRSQDRPATRESLYRLSHRGPQFPILRSKNLTYILAKYVGIQVHFVPSTWTFEGIQLWCSHTSLSNDPMECLHLFLNGAIQLCIINIYYN